MTSKFNIPTILVVFGATGDLMRKKIIPALYYLYSSDSLPKVFEVVAYSRRELADAEYRETVLSALDEYYKGPIDPAKREAFVELFAYHQGTFEQPADYERLGERLGVIDKRHSVCTNKLFYLSVPPQHYRDIFENLKASHLTDPCGPEEGWTRVLVEKPFGDDLATARDLDELLAKLFKEEQIYRIDHYLAKEMLQNILAFRFSNNLFEQAWSNQFIERIDIRLWESLGVEDRGTFYDGVGALRDVGQNHLLQMLALVTMEHPLTLQANAIRQQRAEALRDLEIMDAKDVAQRTVRAQYEGYRTIKGVQPDSQVETYFKVLTELRSPRWQGVPITLEAGKRLGQARKEIVVTFKHPMPCLCPNDAPHHYQNKVVFQLEPTEGITIRFWSKKPGFKLEMEERTLDFMLHQQQARAQYVEEYAKLLIDAICGDQTLFVSTPEVELMWRAIDPIVRAWQEGTMPLLSYQPDTADISAVADEALAKQSLTGQSRAKEVGIVGLGKMGGNTARRLMEQGWRVVGYNRSPDDIKQLETEGMTGAYTLEELVGQLSDQPRVIWLMLPAGKAIDEVIFGIPGGSKGLVNLLQAGDIIVDAGNSFYKDAIRRAEELKQYDIELIDVGFSGGPGGARNGACLMVGGYQPIFHQLEPLFADLAMPGGYQFFEGAGAGHFVKMIHNGIEYGMMQAIAEGFAVMRQSTYNLDLVDVARIYNNGSVIESRLVGWLKRAFESRGEALEGVSGTVKHTGEGQWTVDTASELDVDVKIIEGALEFRKLSEQHPDYTGKILSALREQFGGHSVK